MILHGDHSVCVGSQLRGFYWHLHWTNKHCTRIEKVIYLYVTKAWVITKKEVIQKDRYLLYPLFSKFLIRLSAIRLLFPLVTKQWGTYNSGSPEHTSANVKKLKVPLGQGMNWLDCCFVYPVCYYYYFSF